MQREDKIDLVLLGIPVQVIGIGKALSKQGYFVSYLFGEETPEAASLLIAKAQKGIVAVGAAPSIRHRKVVKTIMRCKKTKTLIWIPNPYELSLTELVDKIVEWVEAKNKTVTTSMISRPKDDRDQIRPPFLYYRSPHPERAAAWHKRAIESLEKGWIEDAIAFCKSALRSDKSHEKSLRLYEDLQQIVKSESNLLEYLDEIIIAKKLDQALCVIQFAIARYPDSVGSLLREARIRLVLADLDGTMKAYNTALEIDRQNLSVLIGLSAVHLLQGNYGFAVDFAKEALRIDSKNVDALINLSGAFVNIGEPKTALKYADNALHIAPTNHIAWNNKGHALLQLGKFSEAKMCFMESLNIEPNYTLALLGITKLLSLGH